MTHHYLINAITGQKMQPSWHSPQHFLEGSDVHSLSVSLPSVPFSSQSSRFVPLPPPGHWADAYLGGI